MLNNMKKILFSILFSLVSFFAISQTYRVVCVDSTVTIYHGSDTLQIQIGDTVKFISTGKVKIDSLVGYIDIEDSIGVYITPYDTTLTHNWINTYFMEFSDSTGNYITLYDTSLTHNWIDVTFLKNADIQDSLDNVHNISFDTLSGKNGSYIINPRSTLLTLTEDTIKGKGVLMTTANLFVPVGDKSTYGIHFGDDEWITNLTDDTLLFYLNDVKSWYLTPTKIFSNANDGIELLETGASSTVPSLIPYRSSSTTGIGGSVSNTIEFICSGINQYRVQQNSMVFKTGLIFDYSSSTLFNITEDTTKITGNLWTSGLFQCNKVITSIDCDTVASAATVTLGLYNNFVISGTADIDSIDIASTVPDWALIYIEFTGTKATNGLVKGKNLKISNTFAYTPDDIIILQRRGNYFYEVSQSVN